MSDERLGDDFLKAVKHLPRGSGIIFRHYSLELAGRRKLFRQVRHIARQRGYLVVLSGAETQALAWRADGWHNRSGKRPLARNLFQTAPVHNAAEISNAKRCGANMVFLSPVFPTASHPEARSLGACGFRRLALLANSPAIALGGMTRARAAMLGKKHMHGWAAISGLSFGKS